MGPGGGALEAPRRERDAPSSAAGFLQVRAAQPATGGGKRWGRLTLFLEREGAPIDNNICENMLKRAILHRKNSLFYKTEHGAHVGDLYMSLIATARLAGANPFDYLTELQRHAKEVANETEQGI